MTQRNAIPILGQRASFGAHPLAGTSPDPRSPVRSLYVHVPFCFHKCHYCDFYSIVDTRDRQEPFVDRLILELRALAPFACEKPLETIFVGGGTPTLLRPDLWERLLGELAACFDLSLMGPGPGEFTVECNPETATDELMAVLRHGGVTRISLGAQSFDVRHLKTLERWHDPDSVPRAIELSRGAGITRQSLDLIYAVPGQTIDEWDRDLTRALSMGTEHLSCYALTYEPNTAMTVRLKRGEFAPALEDLEAEMFVQTVARLREAGLDRYEVSNFARPGAECRHNLAYWRQNDWLAAGPSASGHVLGWRWKGVARLDSYLSEPVPWPHVTDVEAPDAGRAIVERIMTGLRLREGLSGREIKAQADSISPGAQSRLDRLTSRLVAEGLLREPLDDHWTLTDEGFLVADHLVVRFMDALDRPD